jgi:tRNA(Ile)-lysidine synthase
MSCSPITPAEAKALFAPWRRASCLVVAVSGGPDSMALLFLLARWRKALPHGPLLIAATIDHALRPQSAKEARMVKAFAASLGITHVTRRWTGPKPRTGLPAAARTARYALLAAIARCHEAQHILVAHTQDDQAETILMRLIKGSGLIGLKAMTCESQRDGLTLVRPLLTVPKARLLATLAHHGIAFADDPTNRDRHFTRPRLRAAMPLLAEEGLDAEGLARLAMRMQRADATLHHMAETASAKLRLANSEQAGRHDYDAAGFAALPEEIRLRVLIEAIHIVSQSDPPGLSQAESLLRALDDAPQPAKNGLRLRRSLAGAVVTLTATRLSIAPAPLRRGARS